MSMGISPIYDLGPCGVIWNNEDLGATFGDVVLRSEVLGQDVKEDQNGETPVDRVLTGRNVSVEVPFTRLGFDTLKTIIAESVGGTDNVEVNNLVVGHTQYADAKELILKPIVDGAVSTDEDSWIHLFKTVPEENLEITFNNSAQRVFKVTFKVFPSQDSGTLGDLYRFGPAA